jgi:hypothetical protein
MLTPHFNRLIPRSSDYVTLPIIQGFNWEDCFNPNHVGEWYLIVFRSILKPGYDAARLNLADQLALIEAQSSPGFIHYFCGTPISTGQCLSLCLWNSQAEAQRTAQLPAHRLAQSLVDECYQFYRVDTYRLIKSAGTCLPEIIPYP